MAKQVGSVPTGECFLWLLLIGVALAWCWHSWEPAPVLYVQPPVRPVRVDHLEVNACYEQHAETDQLPVCPP